MICVSAEEMVEVYAGDTCIGVAFWPPQVIRVSEEHLRQFSTIRVVVTGSLANRYGQSSVYYGLTSN